MSEFVSLSFGTLACRFQPNVSVSLLGVVSNLSPSLLPMTFSIPNSELENCKEYNLAITNINDIIFHSINFMCMQYFLKFIFDFCPSQNETQYLIHYYPVFYECMSCVTNLAFIPCYRYILVCFTHRRCLSHYSFCSSGARNASSLSPITLSPLVSMTGC